MKSKKISDYLLIIIILLIGISAYIGFRPLLEYFQAGAVKEFLVAIFGTIFTIILTMVLLNKQTQVEEEKVRSEKVFEKKVNLYQEIIKLMESIFNDGSYNYSEIVKLDSLSYNLQLLSSNDTIKKFINFYRSIKIRVYMEVGDNEEKIDFSIPILLEDKIRFGEFVNQCRDELNLSEKELPENVFKDIANIYKISLTGTTLKERAEKLLKTYLLLFEQMKQYGENVEENSALLEAVFSKEMDILDLYNLPPALEYKEILQFNAHDDEGDVIGKIIMELEEASKKYNKITKKKRIELLIEAAKNNEDSENILPQIGITNHIYQIYLYKKIIQDENNANKILEEMDKAEGYLNSIGKTYFNIYELQKAKLEYLNEYFASMEYPWE